MIVFTDEDLKRLKDLMMGFPNSAVSSLDVGEIRALLARLEAAEKVCEAAQYMKRLIYSARFNADMEAWRKAAGK